MNQENWQGINIKGGNNTINNPQFHLPPKPITPSKSIPYQGTPHFVGRQWELASLHQTLQKWDRVAISAVAGMGGVGKTELAIKYAREHQDDYPGGICWLSARDANLAGQILQFALLSLKLEVPQQDWRGNPLDLDQQVAWCWQQWQPPQGRVLVVLDDVTDWKHCRGMLPTDNRFCVLMTTRLRRLDTNFVELPLDVLSEAEALQLLTAILGENDRRLVGGLVGWASRPPGGEKGRQDARPTNKLNHRRCRFQCKNLLNDLFNYNIGRRGSRSDTYDNFSRGKPVFRYF